MDFVKVDAHVHQLKGSSARWSSRLSHPFSRDEWCLSLWAVIRWFSPLDPWSWSIRSSALSAIHLCSTFHKWVFRLDSIGARRVKNACLAFRSSCDGNNFEGWDSDAAHPFSFSSPIECLIHRRVFFLAPSSRSLFLLFFTDAEQKSSWCRCLRCFQQVRNEYTLVKSKLESLLRVNN